MVVKRFTIDVERTVSFYRKYYSEESYTVGRT